MNRRKPPTTGYVRKGDPPRVQVFTFDAHHITLCGSPQFQLPMRHRRATQGRAAIDR